MSKEAVYINHSMNWQRNRGRICHVSANSVWFRVFSYDFNDTSVTLHHCKSSVSNRAAESGLPCSKPLCLRKRIKRERMPSPPAWRELLPPFSSLPLYRVWNQRGSSGGCGSLMRAAFSYKTNQQPTQHLGAKRGPILQVRWQGQAQPRPATRSTRRWLGIHRMRYILGVFKLICLQIKSVNQVMAQLKV